MRQDDQLLVAAALDGELDVAHELALQARLEREPELRAAYARQRALRDAIRESATYHALPAPLHRRLIASLGGSSDTAAAATDRPMPPAPPRRRWAYAAAAALASVALGVGSAQIYLTLSAPETARAVRIGGEAVAGHIRANMLNQVLEVASSDQHTVRPWLSAHVSYSLAVPDLSAQGYDLAGARRDVLDGEPVATLVYRHRQHLISVYVWPAARALPAGSQIERGFNVLLRPAGAYAYCIVSDMNAKDLERFADLLLRESGLPAPEG